MDNNDLFKATKKFLKHKIKEIIYNNEIKLNSNSEGKFIQIIKDNLNNDRIIKYIIKIISYNIKSSKNIIIQNKTYELFLLLIKNLSKKDIEKNLTLLLIILQENINLYSIEIAYELILQKIGKFESKIFEILNGFCIHNIKKNEIKTQKQALLCYDKLILNYENCVEDKNIILKSFIDNIIFNLKIESVINIYQLMVCLNHIVCISKDKFNNYIELTIYYIMNNLFMNDNNIKSITLEIINNIIKFNKDKIEEGIKNELIKNFKKLLDDKLITDINIKKIILSILNKLNINFDIYNDELKKEEEISEDILEQKLENENFEKITKRNNLELKRKNNKINKKNKTKKWEIKIEDDKHNYKKINKLKQNKIHNKNVKIEILVKNNPIDENKILNRQITPLNKYKRKIGEEEFNEKKKKKFISTYLNEDEYINPIQMWYNIDKNSRKNIKKTKLLDNDKNKITIDESINSSQINIINQSKEEPKLELILKDIIEISKNQNLITERIISLEKNTYNKLSFYDSRIDELAKKVFSNELINNKYKIIYPTNAINEKLILFLNNNEANESINLLLDIIEEQMIEIDNNLIEDVINKIIGFLEQDIFIHESINFIKKVFMKNKMRFQLNTIKRLLSAFDRLLMNKNRLMNEDSLDISLIISLINIDKI